MLSYASAHVLLPKLRSLFLKIRGSHQRHLAPWDWTNILLPPTLTEINYHALFTEDHNSSWIPAIILSKFTNLAKLTLWAEHHDWSWDFLARCVVPQSLRHLKTNRRV